MTKYLHVVRGKKGTFKVLDSDTVKIVKQLAGKIPQSGIRYIDDKSVLLQSSSVHDVLDSVKNGGWAHSTNPSRVTKGFKVYIVPNNSLQEKYDAGAIGVSFVAEEDVYEDVNNTFQWASE